MTRQEEVIYALVLGKVISLLREHQNLSQIDLAEAVGITQSMLSRIERGQAQPEAFKLEKLALAFAMASSADLMAFIKNVYAVAERSTQCTIGRRDPAQWWESALQVVGQGGVAELVAYSARVALAQHAPTQQPLAA